MTSFRTRPISCGQGIAILSSCQAVSVDMDQKYLKLKRVSANGDGQLVFGDTIKVSLYISVDCS